MPILNDEQTLYNRAFDALKGRQYAAAIDGFKALSTAYPNGQLADNTQYWLGEAYYVTQDYDLAMASFQRVISQWPNSRKIPDAQLKIGYLQVDRGQTAAGRATLQAIVSEHPGTEAARLAAERLRRLGSAAR
jgi:tol-pal system protein YbgF